MVNHQNSRRLLWVGFSLLALGLGARFAGFISRALVEPSHSFVSYYTASYLLNQGMDVSHFYDDDWFQEQTIRFTPGIEENYVPNPPTAALMLLPLVHYSYADARAIWILVNLAALAAVLAWLLWNEGPRDWRIPGVVVLVLLYQPLYANFRFGQVYALMFALMTLVWYGYRDQRDHLLGISLALMNIFKLTNLFLLALLALQKRWHALIWVNGVILLIALVSLPWIGTEAWLTYARLLPDYSARPYFAVTAYQSVPGLLKHLFFYHPDWNPEPIWDAPVLASTLPGLASILMTAATLFAVRKARRKSLIFAAVVTVNIIANPTTLEYHYTLMLFPLVLLLLDASSWTLREKGGLLCAIVLLSLDYRYWDMSTFLAYPRLCGGLLLWGLALFCSQRDYNRALYVQVEDSVV